MGANLGDPERALTEAVAALAATSALAVRGVSALYRTRPVGRQDQPDFLNAVAAVDVVVWTDPTTAALELLTTCKRIEHVLGRRPRGRWGPREIDLDILVFGRHRIGIGGSLPGNADAPDAEEPVAPDFGPWLVVPHPELRGRLFALAPLADLAPRLVPPGWSETVETARRRLGRFDSAGSVVRIGWWSGSRWRKLDDRTLPSEHGRVG